MCGTYLLPEAKIKKFLTRMTSTLTDVQMWNLISTASPSLHLLVN